ncbi:hypothetical protein FR483_n816R [Paramecium bursaria Chlorella virus FR483]|uniref:Uncharacterized protein n816R n=1 Tax=Paramecium bursaria Chlorella virus FR483 TaxID=399781 RepID=A7J8H0_PBCVF|nr:hypothetical protein FR483_n816R [Paramecium bursaria Chlorella virus FR483]ABT16101.1 hypothetical protein FR483_n816R [Paramecium bursaria Chlorella virus FR483]
MLIRCFGIFFFKILYCSTLTIVILFMLTIDIRSTLHSCGLCAIIFAIVMRVFHVVWNSAEPELLRPEVLLVIVFMKDHLSRFLCFPQLFMKCRECQGVTQTLFPIDADDRIPVLTSQARAP